MKIKAKKNCKTKQREVRSILPENFEVPQTVSSCRTSHPRSSSPTLRCSFRAPQFLRLSGLTRHRWPPDASRTPQSNAAPIEYARLRVGSAKNDAN